MAFPPEAIPHYIAREVAAPPTASRFFSSESVTRAHGSMAGTAAIATPGADLIKAHASVWVWDGYWLPAVVVGPANLPGAFVVRLEHGGSAPLPLTNMRAGEPGAHGSDRPRTASPQPI